MTGLEDILFALRRLPARLGESEASLHARIIRALCGAQIPFRHEVNLGSVAGRVDFLCSGGVAIEAKIGYGSRSRLESQVIRYLAHLSVNALIIVSERRLPAWLTGELNAASRSAGKPVEVVELALGVAV